MVVIWCCRSHLVAHRSKSYLMFTIGCFKYDLLVCAITWLQHHQITTIWPRIWCPLYCFIQNFYENLSPNHFVCNPSFRILNRIPVVFLIWFFIIEKVFIVRWKSTICLKSCIVAKIVLLISNFFHTGRHRWKYNLFIFYFNKGMFYSTIIWWQWWCFWPGSNFSNTSHLILQWTSSLKHCLDQQKILEDFWLCSWLFSWPTHRIDFSMIIFRNNLYLIKINFNLVY